MKILKLFDYRRKLPVCSNSFRDFKVIPLSASLGAWSFLQPRFLNLLLSMCASNARSSITRLYSSCLPDNMRQPDWMNLVKHLCFRLLIVLWCLIKDPGRQEYCSFC